jgi:hypothetical protein
MDLDSSRHPRIKSPLNQRPRCGFLGRLGNLLEHNRCRAMTAAGGRLAGPIIGPVSPRWVFMVKMCLTFRLGSQAYKSRMPFFTNGRSQGLSIHGARRLLALNQALI